MTRTTGTNKYIYLRNDFVRTPLRLDKAEARLFACTLGCLHQKEDNLNVHLRISDVARGDGGTAYELVRNAARGLSSKYVETENTDSKSTRLYKTEPLYATIAVDEGTATISASFNPHLKHFLLQLNGHFTRVQLEIILSLRSGHAHKLYWLLASFRSLAKKNKNNEYKYDYQTLRNQMLGVNSESYILWNDFNRFVLKSALKEITRTGWLVEMKTKTSGKKVSDIIFTLPAIPGEEENKSNELIASKGDEPAFIATTGLQKKAMGRLTKMKLTAAQIDYVMSLLGYDEQQLEKMMKATHPLLSNHESGSKHQDNLGAAAVALLKTEFSVLWQNLK